MRNRQTVLAALGAMVLSMTWGARADAQDRDDDPDVQYERGDVEIEYDDDEIRIEVEDRRPVDEADIDPEELERLQIEAARARREVSADAPPGGDTVEVRREERHPTHLVLEVNGGYGIQFGVTDYLPTGTPDEWQYPITHGPSVGGLLGLMLTRNIALIGAYEYSWATTPHGEVPGILDRIQGTVDYHTFTAGLRVYAPLFFGRLRAELGVGVALPFSTRLELEYGENMEQLPTPITGIGTRESDYSIGFGGHAALDYEIPISESFYVALGLRYRLFESENSGETQRLRNFVTDFDALPPTTTDADITFGDGAERPSTRSVQDVRLRLTVGGGF